MSTPSLTPGWAVALAATAAIGATAALAPVIGGDVGAAMHALFSGVCHQLPERSAHLAGGAVALCHRCFGILLGFAVGIAAAPALGADLRRRVRRDGSIGWLALAGAPTTIDWALGALGVWANTPLSRTVTGAVFGLVAGAILGVNLLSRSPAPHPVPDAR